MLQLEKSWRFTSPSSAPIGLVRVFYGFIEKIATQGDAKRIVESFKYSFSGGGSYSSSLSWAWSDLNDVMATAAENAPLFIEAFWNTCEELEQQGLAVPDLNLVNSALLEHQAGYQIQPPYLRATSVYASIAVPEKIESLAEQARREVAESLDAAERYLLQGQGRRAVQELLWLLETISTAFRGTGGPSETIKGKYFNAIVDEMRAKGSATAQSQILQWMKTMHGFLSSPTGGGVRHGRDLHEGMEILPHEANLYCNLIRSYLTYLMQEHERQMKLSGFIV